MVSQRCARDALDCCSLFPLLTRWLPWSAAQNDNPYKLDAKQFGNAMGTIAHSQAVMAAVRDYKKVWYAVPWNWRHVLHA